MVTHYEDSINKWVDCNEAFSLKTYGVSSSTHSGIAVARKAPLITQQVIDFLGSSGATRVKSLFLL